MRADVLSEKAGKYGERDDVHSAQPECKIPRIPNQMPSPHGLRSPCHHCCAPVFNLPRGQWALLSHLCLVGRPTLETKLDILVIWSCLVHI